MSFRTCLTAAAVAAASLSFTVIPAAAQELALKGGIVVSRFEIKGAEVFDGSITSTVIGGHYRLHFGPVAVQPELYMISRGATFEVEGNEERVKLEYLEIPVLLVVPFQLGALQPYAFAGPWIGLETRCRYTYEEAGLKTNLGCESTSDMFDRRALDYGVTAGGGASYPIGSGRLMLEARHTRGLRDIYDGEGDPEVRNRSFVAMIGYTLNLNLGN
jgi:hypothetical protein